MNPESCNLFEKCECPLCPLENNPGQVWYSEDDICKNPDFKTTTNSMKKLKRKAAQGYFTLEMLTRQFVVRPGIEGIDPDLSDSIKDLEKEYNRKERTWTKRHPEISKERKEKMRELGLKSISSIQKPLSHPSIPEMIDSEGVITHPDPPTNQKSGQNGGIEND